MISPKKSITLQQLTLTYIILVLKYTNKLHWHYHIMFLNQRDVLMSKNIIF